MRLGLQGAHRLNAIRADVPSKYGVQAASAANADGTPPMPRECLLVIPGSSEYDLDLVHASQRLAAALDADWVVVFVEASTLRFLLNRNREHDRRLEIIRIAESLGGAAVVLHGAVVAKTIAAYVRLRQATKILVGSPARVGWHAVTHYARVAALKRFAPGIEVITIAPRARDAAARHRLHGDCDLQSEIFLGRWYHRTLHYHRLPDIRAY